MIAFRQPYGDRLCTPSTDEGLFAELDKAGVFPRIIAVEPMLTPLAPETQSRCGYGPRAEAAYERVPQPADICERKHQGNPASVAANESAENVKRWHYACILAELRSRGLNGITTKEYVEWLEDFHPRNDGEAWALNMVSGRFSELKKKNLICECRAMGRRNGCAVIVLSIGGGA